MALPNNIAASMLESEFRRPHPLGPIKRGEEKAIAASVEQFVATQAAERVSEPQQVFPSFPEAPPHLKRRFWLRKPGPEDGPSWIPWQDLPSDLFWRANLADECKRKIYQAQRIDRKTAESSLTPEGILTIFERERPKIIRAHGVFASGMEFDLHDVYTCAEADILEYYTRRERYGDMSSMMNQRVNEQMLTEIQTTLGIIRKAIIETQNQQSTTRE